MKQLSSLCFFLIIASCAFSQTDSLLINKAFSRLDGKWEGYFEYALEGVNRTASMPAKCTSKWDGKKWVYDVIYDEGEGEVSGGKGEAIASTDDKALQYNGALWNIIQINQSGDSTSFVLEITGKEKRKTITTRHTFVITKDSFFITESVQREGETAFTFTNKHLFRRKK